MKPEGGESGLGEISVEKGHIGFTCDSPVFICCPRIMTNIPPPTLQILDHSRYRRNLYSTPKMISDKRRKETS